MSRSIKLVRGGTIATRTGKGRGRVAGIVVSEAGTYFGVTAQHLLNVDANASVYDVGTGAMIGTRSALAIPEEFEYDGVSEGHFFATIGTFELNATLSEFPASYSDAMLPESVDPYSVIGKPVAKVVDGKLGPAARVLSVGKSIRFADGRSEGARSLHGVIEVVFDQPASMVMAAGEAGSLIVDAQGKAVGVLIGHSGEKCFAAPLHPFLACFGLRVDAGVGMERVSPTRGDIAEYVAQELRDASAGIAEMEKDIFRESPDFRPQQLEVPDHLYQMADEVLG